MTIDRAINGNIVLKLSRDEVDALSSQINECAENAQEVLLKFGRTICDSTIEKADNFG